MKTLKNTCRVFLSRLFYATRCNFKCSKLVVATNLFLCRSFNDDSFCFISLDFFFLLSLMHSAFYILLFCIHIGEKEISWIRSSFFIYFSPTENECRLSTSHFFFHLILSIEKLTKKFALITTQFFLSTLCSLQKFYMNFPR